MFRQTLILIAILTVPFLWVPFMIDYDRLELNIGAIGTPNKARSDVKEELRVLDTEQGIPIYAPVAQSCGTKDEHRAEDGYLFGNKWISTEFVRRYYYQVHNFKMPDDLASAKSFFDPAIQQGAINPKPGLIQFQNGLDEIPMAGDLMVFLEGECGHIGVVTEVSENCVVIAQQNAEEEKTRETLKLHHADGGWKVEGSRSPAAWLRLPQTDTAL